MVGLATKYEGKSGKKMMMANKAGKIVGAMFMSRDFAHRAHLATSSYSQHMALNEFYDSVIDLADSFAEVAQGKFGKLDVANIPVEGNIGMPAEGLEMHLKYIMNEAEDCNNRAMNAIIDQVEELYLSTIYKLRELR